jgi:hypothetical protein
MKEGKRKGEGMEEGRRKEEGREEEDRGVSNYHVFV